MLLHTRVCACALQTLTSQGLIYIHVHTYYLTNDTYVVTVDHPSPTSTFRKFIAELHPATWDRKRKQCLYAGSAQSGAINEVDIPNDHVIEGTYDDYEVSGLFNSDFKYNQFQVCMKQ